jgi:eukaryotic-like serine/threonine-protein kinase
MMLDLAQRGQIDLAPNEAKTLVSEIIARYESVDEFDARSVLEKHPGLQQYPSIVVDLAYEEYCRRVDAGEPTDPQQFAQRFPDVEAPLLKLLEVHEYLDEHPDAFGAVPAPEWPQAGDEVAGFVLVREIGRGGFSRVFLARETDLGDRQVVLKICIQANEEAARLGQLDHPHIVPVHSVQFDSYPPFTLICMPFLGSATLADVIADGFADRSTRPRVADIAATIDRIEEQVGGDRPRQSSLSARSRRLARRRTYAEAIIQTGAEVCEALAYAHRLGICHCDVKPSNVLLTADGRPLLLDFNLSMQSDGTTAVVGGTLPYMAPEQLRYMLGDSGEGVPEIDHRTDLFALGATMFQLLTGRLPFPTDDLPQDRNEAARRLLDKQRASNGCRNELEQVASPRVARLIADCLAFDRESRPGSAEQVARQFRAELKAGARVRNWLRLHQRAVTCAAVLLLMAASVLGIGSGIRAPLHVYQYELGVSSLDAGDFDAAARLFDGALDARRDFEPARLMRGWSDLLAAQAEGTDPATRSKLLKSAEKDFETSWKLRETAEAAASRAWCFEAMGNHHEAARYFDLAVKGDFATPAVLNNLGYCLWKNNDFESAVVQLEEAVRLDPELPAAHRNLVTVYWRMAQDERLKAAGERAVGQEKVANDRELMAADYLQRALSHVDIMRRIEPRFADRELDAARVYAVAYAQLQGDSTVDTVTWKRELFQQVLTACQTAIELHLAPEKLKELADKELAGLVPELAAEPRFQELVKGDPPPVAAIPSRPVVDIFPDIRNRLALVAQ